VRVAITFGDPNGIGPEIALKAAVRFAHDSSLRPVLVGDAFIAEHYREKLAIDLSLTAPTDDTAGRIAIADIPALGSDAFAPGQLDPRAGRATVEYVKSALALARDGVVDAVIGCPHSETAVNRAGIPFNGYVGLVADLLGTPREQAFMMLIAKDLRIAHVTLHESVSTALARMTPELVARAARETLRSAPQLGIANPTLAVFGINPHAGEDGLFGDDEESCGECMTGSQ